MKQLYNILASATCVLCLATSCLDDTIPTNTITEEQKDNASGTIAAMLQAMPAHFHADGSGAYGAYAFGYGAMMHIRDVQTGDLAVTYSEYDHFRNWEQNTGLGSNSGPMQYIWNYNYQAIHAANLLLGVLPADTTQMSDFEKGAKAAAHAFRALFYLDLARAYEFLPNDVYPVAINTDGKEITGLTVPIVTEKTTEEETRNNPRATREQMGVFIAEDLDTAALLIHNLDENPTYGNDRTLPHIYSVHGLQARLYMWLEDYEKAYQAAVDAGREAEAVGIPYMINSNSLYDIGGETPIYIGFNEPSAFMWADTQTSDNSTVQSGINNWTSWMCPLLRDFGYSALGARSCIDINLYNKISPRDYRKYLYMFGTGSYPDGTASKFAPGSFDNVNPLVAGAASYPIMRIEEMRLIEAEAAAHLDPAVGMAMLVAYMNNCCYVTGTYKYTGELTKEGIIDEILTQKRIELWGEGQSFFDIKRLNKSVTRGYNGTNFSDQTRFNTEGRPAWMNWCIVLTEENTNEAVRGMNNPDPSDKYTIWVNN